MTTHTFIAALGLVAALTTPSIAQSEAEKRFHGLYLGADGGVTGNGASYYGGHAGYRHQFDNNIILGVEGTIGQLGNTSNDFFLAPSICLKRI